MRSRDFRRSRTPTGRERKANLYRLFDDDEGNGRWVRSEDFRRSRTPTGRERKAKLYRMFDDDEGNGRWVRPRDFRHEVGTAEGHEHRLVERGKRNYTVCLMKMKGMGGG